MVKNIIVAEKRFYSYTKCPVKELVQFLNQAEEQSENELKLSNTTVSFQAAQHDCDVTVVVRGEKEE